MKSSRIYLGMLAALALLLPSCGEPLFEYEGDCEVTHRIRFCYDMNLKWADAFPSEVTSVNLYVFDGDGLFLKEYADAGEALSQPGYSILLDLPAGDYKFVAWCGLVNAGADRESFTVPRPEPGVTTVAELTASLNTESDGVHASYSDARLDFLYHGYLEARLEDKRDGTDYEYTIYLTKDTNHIRIILQEISSDEDMRAEDYGIRIEAANGVLSGYNDLLGESVVTYLPWWQGPAEVGVGKVDAADGSLKYVRGLVADLSVSRLMAEHRDELMLVITDKTSPDEEVIVRVPLIQYALLSRTYYEAAYGHPLTEQELLDREDEYVMTFFLYQNRWQDSYIDIHQWRLVLHDYELGDD